MSMVENEGFPNFVLKFEVQAFSLEKLPDFRQVIVDDCVFEVLIVEVVEVP